MASGTSNVSDLEAIIQKAENGLVLGTVPGAFSLAPSLALMTAAPSAALTALTALTAGEALLVQNAIQRVNTAAPVAAAPGAVPSIPAIIDAVLGSLTEVSSTPADQGVCCCASATLKWWGWTQDLNDSAAKALQHLLTNDFAGLLAIAIALAVSPPLAALAAIVGAVATGLSAWIAAENTAGKGVRTRGYLWVGVLVTAP